ncbi:F-box domain-containing protein [Favolaschia claudopus]|uniref:F-box domain-containing protein n=1 Tax=Favolaschia claudopus TaxID=2862362 RepID=A0AAW0BZN9_9AGAR
MLSHMEQDRALFAQMEAEILDIEAQMAALVQSRRAVRDAQELIWERLQSYKYPVLSLPNEIVAEIFVHAIPPYPDLPVPRTCPSTVLTQICRQWREIAIGTPQLWRTINLVAQNLPIPQGRSFDSQQAFSQASLWLKRSGSCLLSVHAEDLTPALPVLLPERARWEHLKLSVFDHLPPDMQDCLFPSLRSLNVFRMSTDSATPFRIHSESAPLLHSVTLFTRGGGAVDLPWAQLTSLRLRILKTPDFRRILRQTRRLVHCTLYGYSVIRDPDGLGSEISLPHLESLNIQLDDDGEMDDVLESLLVPSLQVFHVSEDTLGSGSQPIETLKSLISKSKCMLREIQITDAAISSEDAYRTAFPSIARVMVDSI